MLERERPRVVVAERTAAVAGEACLSAGSSRGVDRRAVRRRPRTGWARWLQAGLGGRRPSRSHARRGLGDGRRARGRSGRPGCGRSAPRDGRRTARAPRSCAPPGQASGQSNRHWPRSRKTAAGGQFAAATPRGRSASGRRLGTRASARRGDRPRAAPQRRNRRGRPAGVRARATIAFRPAAGLSSARASGRRRRRSDRRPRSRRRHPFEGAVESSAGMYVAAWGLGRRLMVAASERLGRRLQLSRALREPFAVLRPPAASLDVGLRHPCLGLVRRDRRRRGSWRGPRHSAG